MVTASPTTMFSEISLGSLKNRINSTMVNTSCARMRRVNVRMENTASLHLSHVPVRTATAPRARTMEFVYLGHSRHRAPTVNENFGAVSG